VLARLCAVSQSMQIKIKDPHKATHGLKSRNHIILPGALPHRGQQTLRRVDRVTKCDARLGGVYGRGSHPNIYLAVCNFIDD